jgi:hypothetical protein
VPGGREPGHVHAGLGEQQLRGELADPGDLIQPLDRVGEWGDQRRLQHGSLIWWPGQDL